MSTCQTVENSPAPNPFRRQREYSDAVVELMRALSASRKATGHTSSSPGEILEVVADLGYRQPKGETLVLTAETDRFLSGMTAYQQQNNVAYPTCEDLLAVLRQLGYSRSVEDMDTVTDGLPIDRRRHEGDERAEKSERRMSTALSEQEEMDLSPEEHAVLDALKSLREETGREFASSEELLSIIWELGYRPLNDDGLPTEWLDDEERCRYQMAFTGAIERLARNEPDSEFLSCRRLLQLVQQVGFDR